MAKDIVDDLDELMKKKSHIVDLRKKIGDVCDGNKLGDIESAVLMFITNVYMVHLNHEDAMARSVEFNIRMLTLLKAFKEAEDKYKGRYVL